MPLPSIFPESWRISGSGVETAQAAWGKRVSAEYVPAYPFGNDHDIEAIAQQSGRTTEEVRRSLGLTAIGEATNGEEV